MGKKDRLADITSIKKVAVIEVFAIGSIIVLACAIIGTSLAMRRALTGKEKDVGTAQVVEKHPYALNPIIWACVAAAVIFLGIIIFVWL